MHEQLKISLELQLERLQNERTALDSQIADVENQLGLTKQPESTETPAQRFQAEREAASRMKSPFTFGKK